MVEFEDGKEERAFGCASMALGFDRESRELTRISFLVEGVKNRLGCGSVVRSGRVGYSRLL